MAYAQPISSLKISGFKSIKDMEQPLHLEDLNILLGANGAGKSSFISYFRMLRAMMTQRFQLWVGQQGSAERLLHLGLKETKELASSLKFGLNEYQFSLRPSVDGRLVFSDEKLYFDGPMYGRALLDLGEGQAEASLPKIFESNPYYGWRKDVIKYCFESIHSWQVYHLHDTSETAEIKRLGALENSSRLASDCGNLASFLYALKEENALNYRRITSTIRLAIPFFDDFVLEPRASSGGDQINLQWRQTDSDYTFQPGQLSDGSLRFMGLIAALFQPNPPSTVIIDEPELGLHPYAINLLGAALRSASTVTQVICSTQSVSLLNNFEPEDIVVVDREAGSSVFTRLDAQSLVEWTNEYSLGEIWEKNVIGGRPRK